MATETLEYQKVDVKLLPKQMKFMRSSAKELLYSGAFGAGKTRTLCYKAFAEACKKGAHVGLCRKTCASMQQTTLRTLLEPDADLPPVIPQGYYWHSQQKNIIGIKGGGVIYYFGFDYLERVRSLNLSSCYVDEGVELDEQEYIFLLGRCRQAGNHLRQLGTATNPGPPGHFLYKRFFGVQEPGRELIETNALENWFLPDDYRKVLQSFQGTYHERYVLGKWCAFEGLVYPNFEKCVVEPYVAPTDVLVGGLDFGWNDPFVALAGSLYIDEHGNDILYVWYERYKRNTTIEEHGQHLPPDVQWFADPSEPELIHKLKRMSHAVRPANNAVLAGIEAVNRRIFTRRLHVSNHCKALIAEAGAYRYKSKDEAYVGDKPMDGFDHAMDALRYLVLAIDRYVTLPQKQEAVA